MNGTRRPIRATIILGGLGGLAFLLMGGLGIPGGLRPWASFGILWGLIAIYALLMARWSGRGFPAAFFPLLVLASIGLVLPTGGVTFGLALGIFSWIRSGICYPGSTLSSLVREALLCGGGGLAVAFWMPSTPSAWALGIWLFSLVQALFFVFFEPGDAPVAPPPDPFDQALLRIEDILRE
jgi:hypothetical protein